LTEAEAVFLNLKTVKLAEINRFDIKTRQKLKVYNLLIAKTR
jgi:hypothetical protein